MKGVVYGWFSIIVVILMGVFAAYWASKITGTEKNMLDKSADIAMIVNSAESIRALLTPAIEQASQRAAYELAAQGGGTKEWTSTEPSLDKIPILLADKIRNKLPFGESTFSGKTVEWGSRTVEIKETNDDAFTVSGYMEYSTKDASSSDRLTHNFNTPIQSGFFKVLKTGRKLLESEDWKVSKSVIDNTTGVSGSDCKQKFSGTNDVGGVYTIKTSDYLHFTFQCGVNDKAGLASLSKADMKQATDIANTIAKELESSLKNKYQTFSFKLTPQLLQEGTNIKLTIAVEIADEKTIVSNPEKKLSVDGKTINADFLRLMFENRFKVEYGEKV